MVIRSGGLMIRNQTTVWEGTPATWTGWPNTTGSSSYWAPYSSMYRDQLWVGTVVDKRAKGVARLPLKVYERDDLNRPEAPTHPYARLLRQPNPRMSGFFFWLWVVSTYDVFGESFAGKIRDAGGRPVAMVPLHPTCMHVEDVVDGRAMWTFQNKNVRVEGIPDEDLFHPRTYNPESIHRGLSPLEKLRRTLENEDAARRATSAFWRNGARPGVTLTHPKSLSQPAAERLIMQWNALKAGADNTGQTVILEEGMKAEQHMLTYEEAQYIESRKLNREEVCAAYDIPPPVVHVLDHATYSNITEQMRSMYRDTMAPVLKGFEAELETQVRASVRPGASDPDFGDGVYSEFLMDEVLRGDFEARQEAYAKADYMTVAEKRRLENLPFIEGTDRIIINGAYVPLDAAPVNALGALVRAGFEPEAAAAALGMEPIAHTGLVPVTVTTEEAAAPISSIELRTLMGRLSRQNSLSEVDVDALVDGLNGSAATVRQAFAQAVADGASIADFRQRIKTLEAS